MIGVDADESVAGPLLRILKDMDARFFISRVEKLYLFGDEGIRYVLRLGRERSSTVDGIQREATPATSSALGWPH